MAPTMAPLTNCHGTHIQARWSTPAKGLMTTSCQSSTNDHTAALLLSHKGAAAAEHGGRYARHRWPAGEGRGWGHVEGGPLEAVGCPSIVRGSDPSQRPQPQRCAMVFWRVPCNALEVLC